MKIHITIITIVVFTLVSISSYSQIVDRTRFYYANRVPHYFYDDSTSINIIVNNLSNYNNIVTNLQNIFSNPKDEILSSLEDDNIIVNCEANITINFDSLKTLISFDNNDISFITYKKNINNKYIWFRNELYVKLIDSAYYNSFLVPNLQGYSDYQILNEGNNIYKIIFNNEQNMISAANLLYDTSKVKYSSPDFYSDYKTSSIVDPLFSFQWNLHNESYNKFDILALQTWDFLLSYLGNYGSDIVIAVIDDGVEPHEDLNLPNGTSRVLDGYTCSLFGIGTGRPLETGYHGQICAGVIAAGNNNLGIAGIAPNSKIVPIRIFKNNRKTFREYQIAKGIKKAWDEFDADILNMSWGGQVENDFIIDAIQEALTSGRSGNGCIVVAASGNENNSSVNFPSSVDGVISVGAVAECGVRSGQYQYIIDEGNPCMRWPINSSDLASNYGDKLSVVAPGSNIPSIDRMGISGTNEGNYYNYFYGTSLAAPQVAGIVALILSVNPNLSSSQVKNIIESTTQKNNNYSFNVSKPNGTWNNKMGYGIVNSLKAVIKTIIGTPQIIGENLLNTCENYIFQLNINNADLYTYSWNLSSNLAFVSTNNNMIEIFPISSGSGSIQLNVYYQNKLIHSCFKNINISGNTSFAIVPIDFNQLNITTNTNWASDRLLTSTATIHSGATLNIIGSILCTENAKIIVKPGGKLIIDGGTLTNYCSNTPWQGIVIEGNSNQPQMGTSSNQGVVVVKNNAIIENAICGIKLGDTTDLSKNGGIVYATNSTFKNCKNAVLFAPYRNMNNNVEFANRSKFTECNFLVNNDFYTSGMFFDSHAKLLGVNGISFTGCSFTNTQTNLNSSARSYASSGISAINSGFIVKPKCFSNVISGEVCTAPYINVPSLFSGLDYAIVAVAVDHKNQISVLSSEFYKNDYGIFISGEDNPKILNNAFTIGKDNNNIINRPNGIYLQNSTGFRIEENKFYNNTTSTLDKIGLRIKNCRYDNNQVYNNYFYNLKIGQQFTGLNYNYPTVTDEYAEGLVSVCNKNYSNLQSDIQVELYTQGKYSGINPYQTYHTTINGEDVKCGANNLFTDPTKIVLQYDNNGVFINYYYNTNEALYQPTKFIGIQPIVSEYENSCPSKIFGLYPSTINAQLAAINVDYANIRYNYNQIIDAGNTEELLDLIQGKWSDDVWKLRSELISKSPYLSQEAIYSVAMKNLLPPALLLEICLANPDATKREDFLDNLRYKIPNPLPEYMINLIKASWNQKTLRTELEEELSAFKTYRDEYQTYKTEILLSDTIYNYTDIINHLGSRGSFSDYLSMAEIAINQDDYIQANLYLDLLENNSEKLSEEEAGEIASFRDYISIRESIFLDSANIYNLDSIQIASLETFASSNNYRGAVLARNILCFLYNICIDDVPASPKMLRIGANTQSVENTTPSIVSVKVLPNPANSYVSFIWDMKSYDQPAILFIYDQTGKTVMTKEIENAQGQWIWDLKNTPSGVYVYTLKSDQLILYSGKVIVNK